MICGEISWEAGITGRFWLLLLFTHQLKFHQSTLDHGNNCFEVHSNSAHVEITVNVLHESCQQARLANTRITNGHQLELEFPFALKRAKTRTINQCVMFYTMPSPLISSTFKKKSFFDILSCLSSALSPPPVVEDKRSLVDYEYFF